MLRIQLKLRGAGCSEQERDQQRSKCTIRAPNWMGKRHVLPKQDICKETLFVGHQRTFLLWIGSLIALGRHCGGRQWITGRVSQEGITVTTNELRGWRAPIEIPGFYSQYLNKDSLLAGRPVDEEHIVLAWHGFVFYLWRNSKECLKTFIFRQIFVLLINLWFRIILAITVK